MHTNTRVAKEASSHAMESFLMLAPRCDMMLCPQTNSYEVLEGAHPNVTQHGPYTYREVKIKFDFSYTTDYDNRQVLQFKEWIYWVYQPDMSGDGLDPMVDKYMTFNVPFQAVSNALKAFMGYAWFGAPAAGFPLPGLNGTCTEYSYSDHAKLFTNSRTVDEMLFGYYDCVSQFIPADGLGVAGRFPGLLGPNLLPSAGWNTTSIGALPLKFDQIYTGQDDSDYSRSYVSWKESTYLSVWGSDQANRVYGTDGALFKRNPADGSTVVAFVDDLLRHVPLLNQDGLHVDDLHGIDLMRYVLDPRMLLNSTQFAPNADYYQTKYNGLLDVSKAKQGLPVFMSKPHFLDADQELVEDIIGMAPDRATMDTHLDVEPITGVTFRADKRLQINLQNQPYSFVLPNLQTLTWYPNVGMHFTPVAWIDEHAEIPSNKASQFKSTVYGAQDAIRYVRLLGAIFGALCVALTVHLLIVAQGRVKPASSNTRTALNY